MLLSQKTYQSRTLTLTPQLRQSIKILELPSQELVEHLDSIQLENPFFSLVNNTNAPPLSSSNTYNTASSSSKTNKFTNSAKNNESDILDSISGVANLYDFLQEQINIMFDDEQHRFIANVLMGNLNENGYLDCDLTKLADDMAIDIQTIEHVISLCQTMEPVGIFARDVNECILINAREQDWCDSKVLKLIANIDLIATRKMPKLLKICEYEEDELYGVLKKLKNLNLLPSKGFDQGMPAIIWPDLLLHQKEDGTWYATLNESALPKIMLDQQLYKSCYGNKNLSSDEKQFLSKAYDQAAFYKKAVKQRYETLMKVAQVIIDKQQDFFSIGVRALRPLILNDIATVLDMHESTISRTVNGKYMVTNHGTLELKYFFTKAIRTNKGNQSISNQSIMNAIKSFVANENPKQPLSDEELVEVLKSHNMPIARRTVAKYRDILNIPSSFRRKSQIKL